MPKSFPLATIAWTLIAATLPACAMNSQTDDSEWISLLDGEAGAWRGYLKSDLPAGWQVVGGALTRVADAGDIITRDTFENFELMLEYKVQKAGNSGIFFGVKEDPALAYAYLSGSEFQVLDNAGHADGRNPLTSAGSNFALYAPIRDVTRPVGEWNEVRLIVNKGHVEHWMNGHRLVEYDLGSADWNHRVAMSKFRDMPEYGKTRRGHIALQDHGDRVAFQRIRIRRLD